MNNNNPAWSHQLRISCFTSRKDPKASTLTISWKQLVSNLGNVRRTAETMEQWDAMTRDRRGAIKDVGGLTGGVFADRRRGNKTTVSRSCITLDLDNGLYDPDMLIKNIAGKYNCAICGYSTHSHRPRTPKIRLVIPLLHEMDGHAYEAMTQQLIRDCNLTEYADPTTHQRARLFYWPSASADAKQAKGVMCPDDWQKKAIAYLQETGIWENQGRKWIQPYKMQVTRWGYIKAHDTGYPQ